MNKVPDRKTQRREYLRKKASVYLISAGLLIMLGLRLTATYFRSPVLNLLFNLMWVLLVLDIIWYGFIKRTLRTLKATSYVPAVTLSMLPANEVLVRGAAEPTAPDKTLLRVARESEEAKAEELRRSHLP